MEMQYGLHCIDLNIFNQFLSALTLYIIIEFWQQSCSLYWTYWRTFNLLVQQ